MAHVMVQYSLESLKACAPTQSLSEYRQAIFAFAADEENVMECSGLGIFFPKVLRMACCVMARREGEKAITDHNVTISFVCSEEAPGCAA